MKRKNRYRSPLEELTPEELLRAAEEQEQSGQDGRAFRVAFQARSAAGNGSSDPGCPGSSGRSTRAAAIRAGNSAAIRASKATCCM